MLQCLGFAAESENFALAWLLLDCDLIKVMAKHV